jgi:UDP-N-acetylglucosamine 2-epimerase (non-hydrolysing)
MRGVVNYQGKDVTAARPRDGTGSRRRVLVVFGTRPEAIKLAPVIAALRRSPSLTPIVAVTGQHREMLDHVLETFAIAPDHHLGVFTPGQSLIAMTASALSRLSPVLEATEPDAVLVQGDTTTCFAGALAAFYHRVPVVHLEAGLRTGDPRSPYPEEINRRLTTQLAAIHLAPTASSRDNLLTEGVPPHRIVVTGNTVIDALLWAAQRMCSSGDELLTALDHDSRRVLLVTAHRRESWGPAMRSIATAVAEIARNEPELLIVFPIHRNPLIRDAIVPAVRGLSNVIVTEPLPYGPFARLMARAHIILTDSGGIQEEAPSLGKPVLVMRDTTERPEAITAGTARLVGTDRAAIVLAVRGLLSDELAYESMAHAVNPYGDGHAAARVIQALAYYFGDGPAPTEFDPAEVTSPLGGRC